MAANGRFEPSPDSPKWKMDSPYAVHLAVRDRHATTMIDPRNQWLADLVELASPLAVDAIVQELEEGVDYAAKRPPSAGRDLLSVQLHHPSSESRRGTSAC